MRIQFQIQLNHATSALVGHITLYSLPSLQYAKAPNRNIGLPDRPSTDGRDAVVVAVCVCVMKHSEAGGQGTHAAPAMSSVHVSVPVCLYTSGTAGERVALRLTSHHHYLDCEGCDGEVLLRSHR